MTCWAQSLLLTIAIAACCPMQLKAQLPADPPAGQPQKIENLMYTDGVLGIAHAEVMTIWDAVSESRMREEALKQKFRSSQEDAYYKEALKVRSQIAHRLLEEKLIYAAFTRKSFDIPRDTVDSRVNRQIDLLANGDSDRFRLQIKAMGMTMDDYRKRIERRIAVDAMLNNVIYRQIKIAPQDVLDYYKNNIKDYSKATKVKLILLKVDHKRHGDEAAVRIAKIADALKKGTPFVDVARQYSDLPEKQRDHAIEFLYDQLSTSFKKALTKTAKGFTSAPVVHDGDTYWLHITDCEHGAIIPFADVSAQIHRKLMAQEQQRRYRRYVRKLESQSYVKKYFD